MTFISFYSVKLLLYTFLGLVSTTAHPRVKGGITVIVDEGAGLLREALITLCVGGGGQFGGFSANNFHVNEHRHN